MSSVSSAAPGASRSASAAPTVAAVVVTFNRKALLKQCLEALLAQTQALEAIFIIDNASTDGTEAMLRGEGLLDRPELRYVRLPVNSGGAGGFCEGVKVATAQGFDWIWLMDDDAFAAANALEILASHLDDPSIVAVAPAVYTQGAIVEWHREMLSGCPGFFKLTVPVPSERYREPAVEIDIASFVGVLVRSSAVRQIGYPAADFFIHCDDREYSLRLRNQGRILLVPASVMTHEEAAPKHQIKHQASRRQRRIAFERLWITYFGLRNEISLSYPRTRNRARFYWDVGLFYLRKVGGILLYDDHKWRRIKFLTASIADGFRGRFDNHKPKNILYGPSTLRD